MARILQKTILAVIIVVVMWPAVHVANAEESNAEKVGDILQILIPATGFGTIFYLDDQEGRRQFYKSFFTNLAVTYALKYTINKARPEGHGDHSFPSGHTSAAFQGASYIQKRYGWNYGIPAYIGAAYVGWSRVEGESDKHDVTDVLAGAAIGILSSYCFTNQYKGMTVTPVANNGLYGLNINMKW
ncbi:MAG TPA: phosphatase PAP2 family protein [Balneolales bacterium]|nr:phosphatase PAP2 family protein [Balneolales bacterium]